MREDIKKFIEEYLTPEYLRDAAENKYWEYFEAEDMEGDETTLDVLIRYEAEEVPLDIIQELVQELEEKFQYDLYPITHTEETDQTQKFIKEKLRVVFPYHDKFADFMKQRQDDFQNLLNNWNK